MANEVKYAKGMLVVNRQRLITGNFSAEEGLMWTLVEKTNAGWTLRDSDGFEASGCLENVDFEAPSMLDIMGMRLENVESR